MRLQPHEFIRRFLLHVLPKGFHRIRHYGLLASTNRAQSIATARALLEVAAPAAGPQEQPDFAPHTPRVLPCPCPVLWRAHDRHRELRTRLRAEVATNTDQDRHVMSQTSCERCGFPIPMRWLHARGDLAQPSGIHQCAHRASVRSERSPKRLLYFPELPSLQTPRRNSTSATSFIKLGARIKDALAARSVPNCPRLRALALFGRRSGEPAEPPCCRRPKTSTTGEIHVIQSPRRRGRARLTVRPGRVPLRS